MKIEKISSKIASWSLIFVGIGHTITDLTSPKTSSQNDFIIKMKEFPIEILGSNATIFSFHQGFSLMMGLLLFGYGLLNILILRNNQALSIPTNIVIFNIIICLICLALSIKYFL
ncbi:LIC_13387 family protein [Winogradskyella sp. PC D3.3]